MKAILEAVQILYTLIVGLVVAVERPGEGAEKKAAVVAQILAILDKPGNGIDVPAWIRALLPTLLPVLIDLIVAQLNRMGFLKPSTAS